jgi:hypothetical protein
MPLSLAEKYLSARINMDLPTLSITIECSYWFNIARPYSHKTLEHEFALIVKKKPANQNTELNK